MCGDWRDLQLIEVYDELLGPKRFLTWSKENPMWLCCYRTQIAGHWSALDIKEFQECQCKYIIFFDHSRQDDAWLFVHRVMERDSHFKAAKVSKFARDDVKIIVFLGRDNTRKKKIADVCQQMGFELAAARPKDHMTDLETAMADKYKEYLYYLAKAFEKMSPDGMVEVKSIDF